jgi:hypothetical protein
MRRLTFVPVGLLVAAAALGAAALAVGAGRAATGACPSPRAALRAAALRVPRAIGPCDVGRRVTAFAGRVAAKVPRQSRQLCVVRVRGRYGYHLCLDTENRLLYALAFKRRVPRVCRGGAAIPASALRFPLPRDICNLVGRLVTYQGTGVHVPRSGTTCGVSDTTTSEIELCVTTDRLSFYAKGSVTTSAPPARRATPGRRAER